MVRRTVALALVLVSVYVHVVDSEFQVSPDKAEQSVPIGSNTTFYFGVEPWPPPCCKPDNTDYDKYIHVTLNLYKLKPGAKHKLCDVIYHNGKWDQNSGKCSTYDERMADFTPQYNYQVTFDLNYVTLDDNGEFELEILYGGLEESATVVLVVQVGPPVPTIKRSSSSPLKEGETLDLTCSVSSANPPAELLWQRQTATVTPHPGDYVVAADWMKESISRLTVGPVRRVDHGVSYTCTAFNEVASSSDSTSLTIHYRPYLILEPCNEAHVSYHVIEDDDVHMTCVYDAFPNVTSLSWRSNSSGVMTSLPDMVSKDKLTLHTVQQEDSGVYSCAASNTFGDHQAKCMLDIQYGARIQQQANMTVYEGASVSVTCQYDANPPPDRIYWTSSATDFHQEGAMLTFNPVEAAQPTTYTCVVVNTLTPTGRPRQTWTSQMAMLLSILYKPRWVPYALSKFSGVQGEVVVLVCQAHGYPTPSFYWSRAGQEVAGPGVTISQGTSSSSLRIHALEQPHYGQYTCTVSNTMASTGFTISLHNPGIPDAPQQCSVLDTSDRSIYLICIPGYDGGDVISLGVTPHYPTVTSWQGDNPVLVISGLEPNKTFTWSIYSENRYGKGHGTLKFTAATKDGPPLPTSPPPDVGAIVGGLLGALLVLLAMVAAGLYCRATGGPAAVRHQCCGDSNGEQSQETEQQRRQRQKRSYRYSGSEEVARRYEDTAARHSHHGTGQENKAFESDSVTDRKHRHTDKYQDNETGEIHINFVQRDTETNIDDSEGEITQDEYGIQIHRPARMPLAVSDTDTQHLRNVNNQDNSSRPHDFSSRPHDSVPDSAGHYNTNQYDKIQQYGGQNSKDYSGVDLHHYEEDEWEVDRQDLYFVEQMQEGAFSEVWQAVAERLAGNNQRQTVAVKMIKENSPIEMEQRLLEELQVMKTLRPHPNITSLLGCCTREDPLYVIMEFAANNSLQHYLRQTARTQGAGRQLTSRHLVVFALQVANGMVYISTHGFLHRDLAARSVMLDGRFTCKISDFGFARDVARSRQTEAASKCSLPLRWMAPECMFENVFSTKSDVWAFSVLLWEIYTLGASPYPGMSGSDVMDHIVTGHRLPRPHHCQQALFALLSNCWRSRPDERPDFLVIRDRLESILEKMDGDPDNLVMLVSDMHQNMLEITKQPPGEKC